VAGRRGAASRAARPSPRRDPAPRRGELAGGGGQRPAELVWSRGRLVSGLWRECVLLILLQSKDRFDVCVFLTKEKGKKLDSAFLVSLLVI